MTDYINNAQQRVLKALTMLAGHEVDGLAPGELAKALRTSASNVTRDMANLREAGLAEVRENQRWALTPRMAHMALAVLRHLDTAKCAVDEAQKRYTRDR